MSNLEESMERMRQIIGADDDARTQELMEVAAHISHPLLRPLLVFSDEFPQLRIEFVIDARLLGPRPIVYLGYSLPWVRHEGPFWRRRAVPVPSKLQMKLGDPDSNYGFWDNREDINIDKMVDHVARWLIKHERARGVIEVNRRLQSELPAPAPGVQAALDRLGGRGFEV